MASFEGTLMTDSVDLFFSNCPFRLRDSEFQFVLLGRLLLALAVKGLLSVLFRLSSSCDVCEEIDCRVVV